MFFTGRRQLFKKRRRIFIVAEDSSDSGYHSLKKSLEDLYSMVKKLDQGERVMWDDKHSIGSSDYERIQEIQSEKDDLDRRSSMLLKEAKSKLPEIKMAYEKMDQSLREQARYVRDNYRGKFLAVGERMISDLEEFYGNVDNLIKYSTKERKTELDYKMQQGLKYNISRIVSRINQEYKELNHMLGIRQVSATPSTPIPDYDQRKKLRDQERSKKAAVAIAAPLGIILALPLFIPGLLSSPSQVTGLVSAAAPAAAVYGFQIIFSIAIIMAVVLAMATSVKKLRKHFH